MNISQCKEIMIKIILISLNTFAKQLKKEGTPCVTNIVLALYDFFMSSNRRNAPL